MSSKSRIDASVVDKENPKEQESYTTDIYIGVFFDGTNNNKVQVALGRKFREQDKVSSEKGFEALDRRSVGQLTEDWKNSRAIMSRSNDMSLNKDVASAIGSGDKNQQAEKKYKGANAQNASYTNVTILESLYQTDDTHYSFYVEGSGSHTDYDETMTGLTSAVGLGMGQLSTGVCAKVFRIFDFIKNFFLSSRKSGQAYNLHFEAFGFSRGATAARVFNYVVYSDKVEQEATMFGLADRSREVIGEYSEANGIKSRKVDFLGIFDTVSSMGIRHSDDVADYGLWATNQSKFVVHLCGMDEMRSNFALTDIRSSLNKGNGVEIWMPGCHTDVGGGTTIGQDAVKIINKVDWAVIQRFNNFNTEELEEGKFRQICMLPHQVGTAVPVTTANLAKMGWIDADKRISDDSQWEDKGRGNYFEETNINVHLFRCVEHGYSNVALDLIVYSGNSKRGGMFSSGKNLFPIPQDSNVRSVYTKAKGVVLKPGRHFVLPPSYGELRRKYLHYSANERVATTTADRYLVNAPYTISVGEKTVLTRKIYRGVVSESGSAQEEYLISLDSV